MHVILWSNGMITTFDKSGLINSSLCGFIKDVGWKIVDKINDPETGVTSYSVGDWEGSFCKSTVHKFITFMETCFPRETPEKK